MTAGTLFVSSPKQLAQPRDLSDFPVVRDLFLHPALKDVMSISLDMRLTQIAIVADPTAKYVDVRTYGDPKLANEVCVDVREGHLALSNRSTFETSETEPQVLIVLRIPSRMSVWTSTGFQGPIGIGGIRSDSLSVELRGNARLYTEVAHDLKLTVNGDSIAQVGTVTGELHATSTINGKLVVEQAFGHVVGTARGSSRLTIRGGIGVSGRFHAYNVAKLSYGGIIVGDAIVEQHGIGMLTVNEVRGHCDPRRHRGGVISINREVYAA